MLHKLRLAMGKRDNQYSLCDVLELDEGFFSTKTLDDKKEPLKRATGTQKKNPCDG